MMLLRAQPAAQPVSSQWGRMSVFVSEALPWAARLVQAVLETHA
jgi:hypothetical protein